MLEINIYCCHLSFHIKDKLKIPKSTYNFCLLWLSSKLLLSFGTLSY